MFEEKNKEEKPVEDMFADTDTAPVQAPPSSPTPTPVAPQSLRAPHGRGGNYIWVGVGALVLIVLVGGGAWLALRTSPTVELPDEAAMQEDEVTPAVPAERAMQDTDRDGLTDQDEREVGTDPTRPDTDGDGLSDRDELRVYGSDPLNPDTDGDTYSDGQEVQAGYDPNGPGKLQDIERALMEGK